MTDLIPIRRELLERLADKNASLHHTRKAQDELRAAIDSAPCDPRCAETCVRASMCATCMNALAAPVQGEAVPAAFFKRDSPIKGHTEFMPYEPWMDDGLSGGWVPLYTAPPQPAIAAARKGE